LISSADQFLPDEGYSWVTLTGILLPAKILSIAGTSCRALFNFVAIASTQWGIGYAVATG
jgi:hypothetical protein